MTTAELELTTTGPRTQRTGNVMKALVYHGPGKRAWEDTPRPTIQDASDAICLAASLVSQFKMTDGTEVALRPIRPDDESLMKQFHETLSDRTVYMRYFCSLALRSRVEHERLVRICHVDGNREAALVVDLKDELTGQHHILGVGRLIKLDTGNEGEVAILVSDRYQKHGLGTELLRRVVQIARDQKLCRLSGELLRDNLIIQIMVKRLGFRSNLCLDSPSVTATLEM
jgi:acetyltransferase